MTVESLTCNNCGAPLDVPANANFATCSHCGSQLAIKRTDSATYTEVLEQINTNMGHMSQDLDAIRAQNELEEVDREWQMESEQYMVQGRYGRRSLPNSGGGVVGAVIVGLLVVGFGVFWTIIATFMTSGFLFSEFPFSLVGIVFPLCGVVFIVVALAGIIMSVSKVSQYGKAEQVYLKRREALLQRIKQSR